MKKVLKSFLVLICLILTLTLTIIFGITIFGFYMVVGILCIAIPISAYLTYQDLFGKSKKEQEI